MSDSFGYRIVMGLPKAQTAEEVNDRASIEGMRRAILRAQRDSALICQCLRTAEYQGLRGEDIYTLMAYHALVALEEQWQRNAEWMRLSPSVPPILAPSENGKVSRS